MKTDREKSIGYMPCMSSCGSITHITTDGLGTKITPTGCASVFLLQWRSSGEGVGRESGGGSHHSLY